MINQAMPQSKTDSRGKAIASLVLGIFGTIATIGHIYNTLEGWTINSFRIPEMFKFVGDIIEPFGLISFLFLLAPIIGIILGIKGLKSTKKNIAIGGIIFSIIGLLGLVILFIVWLGFAIGM